MLQTEQNTPAMERRVMAAATRLVQWGSGHHHVTVAFEHGQWWVLCSDCGAIWSVVDAEGPKTFDGFDVEVIEHGDESCL